MNKIFEKIKKMFLNVLSKLKSAMAKCKKNIVEKLTKCYRRFVSRAMSMYYKNKNPYFLDFPVEKAKNDYIGFDAQVDGLYQSIDDNARMIGIVADYGSGKSSVVSLLKKRLGRLKYKVIRINLWNSDKDAKLDENTIFNIHKRFLFQLSNQLSKRSSKYLMKKLNVNYNNACISTKNTATYLLLFISAFLAAVNFLNNIHFLHNINFLPFYNLEWLIPYIKFFVNISGMVSIIVLVAALISSDIMISLPFSKEEKPRIITENDTMEIYLDIIRKKFSWLRRKKVIVIEDLDRLDNDGAIKLFLKQIHTFYTHSNNEKVVFIVALKSVDYFERIEEHYKVFDYTVDLQKLKLKDLSNVFKSLLQSKADILNAKYGILLPEDGIGMWMWLATGKELNIRQIKHRYNESLLLYSTLISRFSKEKSINLKSCIAVTYLKNEYSLLYNEFISENVFADSDNYSDIKKLVNEYIKNKPTDYLTLWSIIDTDYSKKEKDGEVIERFKKDVFSLLKNEYINDTFEIYVYNYPKTNTIFTIEEDKFYQSYLYDKELPDIDDIMKSILINNEKFVKTTINRGEELGKPFPRLIFENETLFEKIYNSSSVEEDEYIFKNMLSISPRTSKITFSRLRKIRNYTVVDDYFISKYIDAIKDDFRADNENIALSNSRVELLEIFDDRQELFQDLYVKDFPNPSQREFEIINSFDLAMSFVNYNLIDAHAIDNISVYINNNYSTSDFQKLYEFMRKLESVFLQQLFKNLKISNEFTNDEKMTISTDFFEKLGLDEPSNIMSFIKNMEYSNELLEDKLILKVAAGILDKELYCDFIDDYIVDMTSKTLEYITSENFNYYYRFRTEIQEKMYENGFYLNYVISKMLYNEELALEENRLDKLKETYLKLYDDEDLFGEYYDYIVRSESILNLYKQERVYASYGEDYLMPFSYIKQDYDMLNEIFNEIQDYDILNEYILNIKEIEISDEDCNTLLENYADKLANVSDETYIHLKDLLPTKGLKIKLSRYRITRRLMQTV